ncbi:MAG: hypothetical protein F4Z74_07070 [Acidobacteria bacterium]|nr:hypothetical protein [Acidobacteriota bacterium]
MADLRDRFSSSLGNLSISLVVAVVGGLITTAIAAKMGANAVLDLLARIPWSYIGILLAAWLGLFAGGMLIEMRAVARSRRLIHWLAREASKAEDLDRVEWVFGFTHGDEIVGVVLEGEVLSKRTVRSYPEIGLLQLRERGGDVLWCSLSRGSPLFRDAREGEAITIAAAPIGVVGNEVCWRAAEDT